MITVFWLCGVVYAVGGALWFTTIGFLDEAVSDDLKEARALRGVVPSSFYLGMAIGASVLGALSDKSCGRRRVVLLSMALSALASLLGAAMSSVYGVAAAMLFVGAGVGGCLPVASALLAESNALAAAARRRWVTMLGVFFGAGAIPVALADGAILSRSSDFIDIAPWRTMLVILGAFELFAVSFLACFLPESEQWREEHEEAGAARGSAAEERALREAPLIDKCDPEGGGAALAATAVAASHICARSLCAKTALLWFCWFGFNFATSGVTAFLPQLLDGGRAAAGAPQPNAEWQQQAQSVALYSIAAVVGVVLASLFVNCRGGRRVVLGSCMLLTAACTALFAWPDAGALALLLFGCASSLISNVAWATLSLVTVEAYPTRLRASGFGAAHAFHSVGGVLGPILGGVFIGRGVTGTVVAVGAFAVFCAAAGFAACALRPAEEDAAAVGIAVVPEELFAIGGVAPAPRSPPLLRRRVCTGIGNATRMVSDPAERERVARPGVCAALPETLRGPIEGFPLVARPTALSQRAGGASLAAYGRAARVLLDRDLAGAGVVLLTGLPITSASEFDALVVGMGYPSMETMGASEREKKAANVFGASDDVPATHTLHPHNEQAYLGGEVRVCCVLSVRVLGCLRAPSPWQFAPRARCRTCASSAPRPSRLNNTASH